MLSRNFCKTVRVNFCNFHTVPWHSARNHKCAAQLLKSSSFYEIFSFKWEWIFVFSTMCSLTHFVSNVSWNIIQTISEVCILVFPRKKLQFENFHIANINFQKFWPILETNNVENEKFTLTEKIFREINTLVTSSTNFLSKKCESKFP